MNKSQLSVFLAEGGGDKPYRELIQYHIKRTPAVNLQKAVTGESSLLPEGLQARVIDYIDVINQQFGYDSVFWKQSTCRQAFEAIINIAINIFSPSINISSVEEALNPEKHELAFQLFQIPTLSFAYSASTQRKQRKFMGIRKGLFG